jgi:hypothetical protein
MNLAVTGLRGGVTDGAQILDALRRRARPPG